uniref:Plasmid partitioning protein RepB n=1 Tax=Methylobacterium oryzae CBMB20 TaxID=693986 RepID=A0A088B2B1_9HYPH|nr:plasmid partitioning protein RepB [Methylobacterium oryzae CBMB20]
MRLGGWAETAGFGASDAAAGGNDVNRAFRLKPPSPMPS